MTCPIYRTLFIAIISAATLSTNAQLDIQISKPVSFNAKDPFKTAGFQLTSDDYIYMAINRVKIKKNDSKQDDHLLQSFDKKSLRKKAALKLGKYIPKDGELVDITRTLNSIVIFSKKESLKETTIYASRFDWDLDELMPMKEIATFDRFKTHYDIKVRKGTDQVALMTQKYVDEGEQIKVQYTIFDNDFKMANTGTINFPLVKKNQNKGLFSKWYSTETSILDDIYFVSSGEFIALIISNAKEKHKQGVWNLMFVNSTTNEVTNQIIELEDERWIQYPRLFIEDNELMITGFYRGATTKRNILSRNTKSVATARTEGTFLQRFDLDSRKLLGKSQAPFSKDFIYNINKQNPANKSLFSSTVRNPELDDISDKYRLKKVIYNSENSTARMYCEYIHNYYTTSTDQNGHTTTKYHSERGNLFYFEISLKNGKVNWGNSIRKYAKYSGSRSVWYITTMRVLPGKKKDAVLYLTQKLFNERDKTDIKGAKIKVKKFEQNFVTASVDLKRGDYDLTLPKIASGKLKSEEKIQFGNVWWNDAEQTLYTINTRFKMNIGFTALACCTMPVCGVGCLLYWFMPDKRGYEIYSIGKVRNTST